tara:strand:+ start:683 stop:1360 length:678 start_codon:yes stop_codon:yes gene_type:complete
MAAIENNVKALVGATYSFSNNEEDILYRNAIATVADTLTIDMLKLYSEFVELTNASPHFDTKGKKILMVSWGGANGLDKVCKPVDYALAKRMSNTESIYQFDASTGQSLNPVYYIEPNSTGGYAYLKVLPVPTDAHSGYVHYFTYPTSADLSEDTTISNFPDRAYQAVYLKTAELILNTLINDAVVDEEDPELLTLYQNNLSSVKAWYGEEISNLTGGDTTAQAE